MSGNIQRSARWVVALAIGAVAVTTCGLATLDGGEAEGQLAPVAPPVARSTRGQPAPSPRACQAASGEPRLLEARTTCAGCAPDAVVVELTFDRVVDTVETLGRIQVSPDARLESRSSRCARRVLVGGALAAQTDYTFTIPGAPGEPPRELLVETGGGYPQLRMPAPMAVLAPGAGLPIQLTQVRRPRLRVLPLTADEIPTAARASGVVPSDRRAEDLLPEQWRGRLTEVALDPAAADEDGVQHVDPFGAGDGPVLAILEAPGAASRVTIAQRAHHSVVLKVGRAGGVVWVAEPRTGRPVSGAAVTIYEGTDRRFSGRTDGDGLLRLPEESRLRRGAAVDGSPPRRGRRRMVSSVAAPLRAVVSAGGRVTYASEAFRTGIEPWQLGLPHGYGAGEARGMITAERGIYRPGETVHLLGILRELSPEGALRAPRGRVRITVVDPDGTALRDTQVGLSPYGTLREELSLGAGARLGRYQVAVRTPSGAELRGRFEVGEYRADSFAVEVAPPGPAELDGGELVLPVSARYLYGAPLAGGQAEWTLHWRPRRVQVAGAPGFVFGDPEVDDYARFVTSGQVALDATGHAEVRLPRALLPDGEGAQAMELIFEASVMDEAGDTVAGRTVQSLSTGDVWVGLKTDRWAVSHQAGWTIQVAAVDPQGALVAGHPIRVRLVRPTWRTHAERGRHGVRYDGEWEDVEIAARELTSGTAPREERFALPGGGRYRAELLDEGGRVLAEVQVYAYGGEVDAPVLNHPRVDVLADQSSYRPGDTASLFPQVPWARSLALVTVEREGVMEARVETLDGPGTPIRVRVDDRHAPNVFVGVAALPIGGESPASGVPLRVGYRELTVSPEQRRLDVEVRPSERELEPGEEAEVDVTVRDHRGRPVRAEVTLWAADEGVLRLTGYQTPDPFAPVHARRSSQVTTAASLAQWTQPDPYTWPDGGGDAPAEGASALRSRFLSTAFFSRRAVVTDGAGHARVRFEMPDNLTEWRVMAAVADRGDRFGSAEARVTTSKPLSAMPSLPRFLTQGDLVDAGVVVHNHTGEAGTATVRLAVTGPARIVGGDVRRVEVADGERIPVRFTVVAAGTGEVGVRAIATLGEAQDGFQVAIPSHPPTTVTTRRISDGELSGSREQWLRVPRGALPGESELVINVSRGVYSEMESGIDSLIEYPHGCVEQTTSRLIPMVLLEEVLRDMGDPRLSGDAHRRRMDEAIAHVLRHQNDDGGFGLWPTSSSEGFLTAYALWGLLTSRDHGYSVDAQVIERATAYLEEHASHGDDMHGQFSDREIEPFAAYVLAQARRDDHGLADRLSAEHGTLSQFSLGLLADALQRRERAGVAPLLASIDQSARPSSGGALIEDPRGAGDYMSYGSDVRATSSAVQAMIASGDRDGAARLIGGILGERRRDGGWGTTYNNMWALYALTSYARSAPAPRGEAASVAVRIDGREVGRIPLGANAASRQIRIPASSLPAPGGGASLVLTPPRGQNLRFSARLRYVPGADQQPPVNRGLQVTRELHDAVTSAPVAHPQVGQLVRVTLRLRASRDTEQVALTDYLPAGLEPVDQRLETRGGAGVDVGGAGWEWVAMHDERVTFFARSVRGDRVAEYLARVTRSGEFVRPAPRAEAMYDPEVYGVGALERVVITQPAP